MTHLCIRSGRSIKHPRRGEEGQSLVETALVLPVMFSLIIGMMVMFLAFYTHAYISELAREGTRYAAVHGSSCTTSAGASCELTVSQINTYVAGIGLPNLGGGTMSASNVTTTFPDGDQVPPHRVKIVVTYSFPYKIPYVMNSTLSMSSTSVMDILQ
jgi:Flp pilus assembly protein TadG